MDFSKFHDITTFIFDVDGVLSDGSLQITEAGELLRTVSARDGMGIRMAIDAGYNVAIITGGKSPGVEDRFRALGVQDYYGSAWNKAEVLDDYLALKNLAFANVSFMGDDVNDLAVLKKVGLSACPKNAANDILPICEFVSTYDGGKGCARELIEKTMRIQNKWITS